MKNNLVSRLRQRPAGLVDNLYRFTALLALFPAIRSDVLLPWTWDALPDRVFATAYVENPFGLMVFALAAVALLLVIVTRRYRGALAVAAFLAIGVVSLGPEGARLGETYPILNSGYIALAFSLAVYFVVAERVVSPGFFVFVAILCAWQRFDNLLAWPQIIVFVVAAMVSSLVVETVRQNWPLARQLGRSNLLGLTWRTLRLWWPMLGLIFAGIWISDRITEATEEAVYASGVVRPYCYVDAVGPQAILQCPDATLQVADASLQRYPVDEFVYDCVHWLNWNPEIPTEPEPARFRCPRADPTPEFWSLTRLGFFDSMDRSVERDYDIREWRLKRQIASLRQAAFRTEAGAGSEAKKLYALVPETTGMKGSDCDVLHVSCHAANIVIGELNAAYEKARRDGEGKFVAYVQTKATATNKPFQDLTKETEREMLNVLGAFEQRTRNAIGRVHTASNVTRQILLLWLVVVAIKSMLFVFARVIFDKSTNIHVDLLESDGPVRQGKVRQVQEVDIAPDYPHTLYYKSNYQPLGPAPRFSIPQWRASALSRLRFGAWSMSQVRMPLDSEDRVTFNSIEGEHLVDWTLQEGEEVVFSYRNFVAMNENIELRTVISLRVATLLLGRIVFHTARCKGGEGRLILRTRGKPATAAQVRQSIPVARLVAWNRYAKFSVDSHLTTVDIFLNGFNLRRSASENSGEPQGILIVEADARDGGLLIGTLRFARTFLLPV